MAKDWNWTSEEAKEALVVKQVRAIAIYTNVNGDIVLRQESHLGEEDTIICFPPSVADAVISAIHREVKLAEEL